MPCYRMFLCWFVAVLTVSASTTGLIRRGIGSDHLFPARLLARTDGSATLASNTPRARAARRSQRQRSGSNEGHGPMQEASSPRAKSPSPDPGSQQSSQLTVPRKRTQPPPSPLNILAMTQGPIKLHRGRERQRRPSPPSRSPSPVGQVLAGGPSFAGAVVHGPGILQTGTDRVRMQEIEVPPGKTRVASTQSEHSAFANGIPLPGGSAVAVATGPAVAGLGFVYADRKGYVQTYYGHRQTHDEMVPGEELRRDVRDDGSGKPNAGTTVYAEGMGHASAVALKKLDFPP